MLKVALGVICCVSLAPALFAQNLDRDEVEKPKYTVVGHLENVEFRRYDAYIVAEVTIGADENTAMTQGFRPLADYIFGSNAVQDEIAMTSPVLQQAAQSKEIAMTSPVLQTAGEGEDKGKPSQTVQFVMPSEYTLESLPKPNNPQVILKEVPQSTVAVLTFSGFGAMKDMHEKEAELRTVLNGHKIGVTGAPMYARYDPPWTPAAERLNEVMLPVDGAALEAVAK